MFLEQKANVINQKIQETGIKFTLTVQILMNDFEVLILCLYYFIATVIMHFDNYNIRVIFNRSYHSGLLRQRDSATRKSGSESNLRH